MTTSSDALAALQTLIAEHDALSASLGVVTTQRDEANARILVLQQDNTALREQNVTLDQRVQELLRVRNQLGDEVLRLEDALADALAEIKRLKDLYEPSPPPPVRVLESYGAPGGGGINLIEPLPDKSVLIGTDVGAMVRLPSDISSEPWEGMKWNKGLGKARHPASLVTDPVTGKLYLHCGPGSRTGTAQEGVFVFDPITQEWSGPLPGSKDLYVNSQNSYGEPGSATGWPFGYGSWEQRSVGRLTWPRANGELVCGQFGFGPAGRGGVAVLNAAGTSKRIIPGTENWACRAVQQLFDGVYLVSVEKQRVANTALPTPGGLYTVNVVDNTIKRLTEYPDTPEHSDTIVGTTVVACRNAGVYRNGQDITFNLPRASEWYSVAINERGDILAGCMDPQNVAGRFWSVALLRAGMTIWQNLTPAPLAPGLYLDTLNSAEPFAAVNRNNTLGLGGATVTDVAWRGDEPMCSASGIVWGLPQGELYMQPAPGSWILVNRAYDRTPDGYEAFAASDFRALWRKPGGRWQKAPFSGGNDGADVSWVGHVLHWQGPNGERQMWSPDAGGPALTTSGAMPPKQPQAPMTDETRQVIIDSFEVQQFGERYGTFAISETDLVVYGHGAAISRSVQP